jgi:D-3-phosphoglycerate dehydrogenase / 2-oxoglutarate reductase
MVQALAEGRVSGTGLDVLEKEPPDPQHPLLTMENVILAPHVGFYSVESISELKRRTTENISAVLMGQWPRSVVNQEMGSRRTSDCAYSE